MGFFSSPASPVNPVAAAAAPPGSGAPVSAAFPDKSKRRVCWSARDGYLACLDRSYGIDAPSVDANSLCLRELAEFQKACPSSWVKHFINKREAEIRDRKLGLRPARQAAAAPAATSQA
ncbi:hypothetical protein H9P43_009110 [Blastocladiella emersonii ATCC 22665]|nr:hypothetical protein H9P43_009110 [Blastocladiella emersonii ATCC 22665]